MRLIFSFSRRGGCLSERNKSKTSRSTSSPNLQGYSNANTQSLSHYSLNPQSRSTMPSSVADAIIETASTQAPTSAQQANSNEYSYTLHSISSQFAHILDYPQHPTEPYVKSCPYHASILEFRTQSVSASPNQHPSPLPQEVNTGTHLSSYLDSNPAEQYALFNRGDSNVLSTERDCVCGHIWHGDVWTTH